MVKIAPLSSTRSRGMEADEILNALSDAIITLDPGGSIGYVNQAAEHFFSMSARQLQGQHLHTILPEDSAVFTLLAQLRAGGESLAEHDLMLSGPRFDARHVSLRLSRIPGFPDDIVAVFSERGLVERIDRQVTQNKIGRALNAMAATLAHEVKNPLSGIRGAAQLLGKRVADDADQELAHLIAEEADRIQALVEVVENFAHDRPVIRQAVNLHEVLHYVCSMAVNGFAKGVSLKEVYDPSLPEARGNREQLIQVFLNLLKNACEAGNEIVLETAYHHDQVRLVSPLSATQQALPLRVGFRDNGAGIPEHLRDCLFDPFVTGKSKGFGMGLAVVARIINDHGGVVEFESRPGRTMFNVLLPVHDPLHSDPTLAGHS